jgi:hypothetical protein
MPSDSDIKRQLEHLIVDEFRLAPKPPREQIISHACEECFRLRDDFAPFDALDIPGSVILRHADSLPLLSPEGLRHYLPAYLLFSLRNSDSDVFQLTLFHLAPETPGDEYWGRRLAVFTPQEKAAVRAFLEFLKTAPEFEWYREEIDRGLSLWGSQP